MVLSPMSQQGPYIPFEKPVPVFERLAWEQPLHSVCFNEQWSPVVIGCLKALCRPETWEGDQSQIQAAIASAHEVLASELNSCGSPVVSPGWHLIENATLVTPYDSTLNFWEEEPNRAVPTYHTQLYFGSIRAADPNGNARVTFEGRRNDDNSLCGGKVYKVRCIFSRVVIGNVWTFQWKDCLGVTSLETSGGLLFEKDDFVAQWFCITSTCPFALFIEIQDDPLCGVA